MPGILRGARSFAASLAFLVVAACGLYQGVEEFEAYRTAFEKTYGTSTAILDQLAVQERELFMRTTRGRIDPAKRNFDPELARYYTDVGDPPGTGAFRRGLDTVKLYNDLLYGLSSGQTAANLTAKAAALNGKVGEALVETGGLAGIDQVQLKAAALALNGIFTRLTPFIQTGLTLQSRYEFREYVIRYHPVVRELLIELRGGTRAIFPVLTAATLRRWRNAPSGGLSAEEVNKMETYRKLLADWVILIDATILALDKVKLAIEAEPTIGGSVTGLTTVAIELEVASQAARKHLAELSK